MAPPISLALGRFKQLPQRTSEIWQGGLMRLPTWIENPDDPEGAPYQPMGAVWVSLRTGRVNIQMPPDGRSASAETALSCLFEFAAKEAKDLGGRPSRIEVRDAELKSALETALAGTGTIIVTVDELPAVKEVLRNFERVDAPVLYPGLLEAAGMEVASVRAFAEAAARFYEARPWQHLANEDLIVVDSPGAPKGLNCMCVLGHGGEQFGLAFFEGRRAFERTLSQRDPSQTRRAFGVTFGPVNEMAFADIDLWEDHALPVADPLAYPIAADFRRDRILRPDARSLAFIEALLRALADTSEDELDAGRWTREVANFNGRVTLSFSLPFLLEAERGEAPHGVPRPEILPRLAERGSVQMERLLGQREFDSADEMNRALDEARQQGLFEAPPEVQAGRPLTALEQAQELAYDALEASGRLRIKLARKALSLSPDCADACIILGNAALTPEAALEWYQRGVDAGARAIGGERLNEASALWEQLEARPYMRARLALAQVFDETGRVNEAIVQYRDLLQMNRNDNQGIRYLLIPLLLEQQRDEEAGSLIAEYQDDMQAIWPYARALWTFRTQGDSNAAREALQEATRKNRHVIRYLLEPDTMPERAPHFALGSKEEAAFAATELLAAFEETEGALEWLQMHPGSPRAPRKKKKK